MLPYNQLQPINFIQVTILFVLQKKSIIIVIIDYNCL